MSIATDRFFYIIIYAVTVLTGTAKVAHLAILTATSTSHNSPMTICGKTFCKKHQILSKQEQQNRQNQCLLFGALTLLSMQYTSNGPYQGNHHSRCSHGNASHWDTKSFLEYTWCLLLLQVSSKHQKRNTDLTNANVLIYKLFLGILSVRRTTFVFCTDILRYNY